MLIQCNKTEPLIQPPISISSQSRIEKEEANVRYYPLIKEEFIESIFPNVKTCLDCIYNGLKLSDNGDCFGFHKEIKKDYIWISYEQVIKRMKEFGSGLITLGCKPSNFTKVCIYSSNRVEFSIAQYGCYHYSIVVVPLYETLTNNQRTHIINEVQPECIVVDNINRVKRILDTIGDTPNLKLIICMDSAMPSELESEAEKHSVKILPLSKVEKIGRGSLQPINQPDADSLAMIMYTSGTTGLPKGTMLTHRNFVASASGLAMHIYNTHDVGKFTFLSFLPMSHSFEQCCQTTLLLCGARIGFFSGDIKTIAQDMKVLKPSLLILVPRLMNRIYNSVMAEVRKSKIKSMMFRKALKIKSKQINSFLYKRNTLMDKIVFSKFREKLGGNIRLIACGSAPLSPTILSFFRAALTCIVVEGFGQTETCGASLVQFPGDYTTGHVGVPLCCCKLKLVDVPEMNYRFEENKCGEICLKGANVFIGYYKDKESTLKSFDEDGWLLTGDIGRLNEHGTISIIDRKKHIFKLQQGEYIAPEKVENVYMQSSFVAQVFVDGDSSENYIVAVVVPDIEALNHWCNERSISLTLEEACENPSFKKTVFEDMLSVGVREKLNSLEQIKDIYLHSDPFSIENNLLTPTLKIRRHDCREYFKDVVKKMYNQSN